MDDSTPNRFASRGESILRRRLIKALQTEQKFLGIAKELFEWQARGWGPVLFGGFLRDLMILGHKKWPRDLDIVLTFQTIQQLEKELIKANPRRNRFGGLHCEIKKWNCDVWPLETTWGFHQKPSIEATPANLPRTTFLNVEAIAVELGDDGSIGPLHQNGFFEAVHAKLLDVNFEENPYPPLAAVRALLTARKLDFALAPRLSKYVLAVAEREKLDSLIEAQLSHYGEVRLAKADLESILPSLERSVWLNEPQRVGPVIAKQYTFWL